MAQKLNSYAEMKANQEHFKKSNTKRKPTSSYNNYIIDNRKEEEYNQKPRNKPKRMSKISRELNTSLKDFFFCDNDQSDIDDSILDESGLLNYLS